MIRTYSLKSHANQNKDFQIIELLRQYRKSASKITCSQWELYYTTNKFNKNKKINITSQLSARYLQTCQYQVVGMLSSYISNLQNRFVDIVSNSSLDEPTKIQLYFINKYQKYHCKEVIMKKKPIDQNILKLARKIFHHLSKNKPSCKHINMALDSKVAKIEVNNGESSFDYWIKLSTLEKNHVISIPLSSNEYFDSKKGDIKPFIQINEKNKPEICLIKDIEKRPYLPLTEKIGLDVGLKTLLATDNGDLFGRKFYSKLIDLDNKIEKLQKEIKKYTDKLLASQKYRRLISIRRNYVKNEINKALNRIIEIYSPREIVVEKLNFQNSDLSRRLNRILNSFGKAIIEKKLEALKEEFGIIITKVNPAYTSQECSSCGYVDKSSRKSQELYVCSKCSKKIHADVNGARNILRRSSSSELSNNFASVKNIFHLLMSQYMERKTSLHSKASELVKQVIQNNSSNTFKVSATFA